jgi:CMP-N-acetylneuraminic acid synthetase
MKNVVIITAKGGNTSIANKNMLSINGHPILYYPMQAARLSSLTDGIFLSTEDAGMKKFSLEQGIQVIDRPDELSKPGSEIGDVIQHATAYIKNLHPEVENCIALLGNTVMVSKELINAAFEELEKNDCDSVLSAWKAQDDHPYRALKVNESGYVESFTGVKVGANRQSYPTAYFYDQGIWGFKWECAIKRNGPPPWNWMGNKCRLIERIWVTGRDIHSWIDVASSQWYLSSLQPSGLDYFATIKPEDQNN